MAADRCIMSVLNPEPQGVSPDNLTDLTGFEVASSLTWQTGAASPTVYAASSSSPPQELRISADNGVTWTSPFSWGSVIASTYTIKMRYINGLFVSLGFTGEIFYSSDASSWSKSTALQGVMANDNVKDIVWDGTYYHVGGKDGTGAYATSITGPWTNNPSWANWGAYDCTVLENFDGILVAVGENGKMMTCPAGTTTFTQTTNLTDQTSWSTGISDKIYGLDRHPSGRWVVTGNAGRVAYSDDEGDTWTLIFPTELLSTSITLFKIVGTTYIFGGYSFSRIWTSTDLVTFTLVNFQTELGWLLNDNPYAFLSRTGQSDACIICYGPHAALLGP